MNPRSERRGRGPVTDAGPEAAGSSPAMSCRMPQAFPLVSAVSATKEIKSPNTGDRLNLLGVQGTLKDNRKRGEEKAN